MFVEVNRNHHTHNIFKKLKNFLKFIQEISLKTNWIWDSKSDPFGDLLIILEGANNEIKILNYP